MIGQVHILATCKRLELLPATLLVFRSLRTGFPTAKVSVWGNRLSFDAEKAVAAACAATRCGFTPLPAYTPHDVWIDRLLDYSADPIWVCDTDMVFFGSVESFGGGLMAGRYEPAFVEPWTKTHKAARLHTSLLWLNAPAIRNAVREWVCQWHPKGFPFTPSTEFVRQQFIPQFGKPPLFYDTCAGLYQAFGGQHFTDEQNAVFAHLHCGVYADQISSALPGIRGVHQAVFLNPEHARSLHREQQAFYEANAVT